MSGTISARILPATLLLAFTIAPIGAQVPRTTPWLDPAWSTSSGDGARALLWFDRQLLPDGASYAERAAQLGDARRSDVRRPVIDTLKALSAASWLAARDSIAALEQRGLLTNCVRSWIINAVTCDLPQGDPAVLAGIPGVSRVYRAATRSTAQSGADVRAVPRSVEQPFRADPDKADWNARTLGVDRVWREYGLTGAGVLQVVHDFGWTFGPEAIRATLWHSPEETADDGIDNDGNGFIDDVHGFNFDTGDADLRVASSGLPGGMSHGDLTAAYLAGREAADTAVVVGMAPGSRWAAVISTLSIMPAVEWAIEQDAHTYSMSFSIPNLGELRGVWRKVMEHGSLAGLFFVSGAGNFADSTRPNFVPVPVQMRIPEDIPHAVLGVAGVGRDGTRPVFSSQGPVEWRTVEYTEGLVPKPDLVTINTNLLGIDSLGNAFVPSPRGWSGNSFAGPHLAGVLALMIEADPELTPWKAREILMETARDIGAPGFDPQSGAGLVDAYRAVTVVRERAAVRR